MAAVHQTTLKQMEEKTAFSSHSRELRQPNTAPIHLFSNNLAHLGYLLDVTSTTLNTED
jgi:hypothetical protein